MGYGRVVTEVMVTRVHAKQVASDRHVGTQETIGQRIRTGNINAR